MNLPTVFYVFEIAVLVLAVWAVIVNRTRLRLAAVAALCLYIMWRELLIVEFAQGILKQEIANGNLSLDYTLGVFEAVVYRTSTGFFVFLVLVIIAAIAICGIVRGDKMRIKSASNRKRDFQAKIVGMLILDFLLLMGDTETHGYSSNALHMLWTNIPEAAIEGAKAVSVYYDLRAYTLLLALALILAIYIRALKAREREIEEEIASAQIDTAPLQSSKAGSL